MEDPERRAETLRPVAPIPPGQAPVPAGPNTEPEMTAPNSVAVDGDHPAAVHLAAAEAPPMEPDVAHQEQAVKADQPADQAVAAGQAAGAAGQSAVVTD